MFSVFWDGALNQNVSFVAPVNSCSKFWAHLPKLFDSSAAGALERESAVLYRLLYKSVAQTDLDAGEITSILEQSRRRNEADGITGVLLYHNRHIMQVLEGEQETLDACYARIRRDPRHANVKTLSYSLAGKKQFSDWFMGYEKPDQIASAPKTVVTLDQLRARLDTDEQELGHRRMAVMSRLKSYLLTIANEGPATA